MIWGVWFGDKTEAVSPQLHFGPLPEGTCDLICLRSSRGEQAERSKDVPRGEGSAVVVAIETVFLVAIFDVQDPSHPFLSEVGAVGRIEEKRCIDVGLVALPIVSVWQRSDVRFRACEKLVQLVHELAATLEEGDQAFGIERDCPAPLQCAPFDIRARVLPPTVEIGQQKRTELQKRAVGIPGL